MKFEWNEAKNRSNIRKHGFDFADASSVFQGPVVARPDTREDYGEDRRQAVGMLRGCAVVLIFTEREPDIMRIISMRKAKKHEQTAYEKDLKDRLETN